MSARPSITPHVVLHLIVVLFLAFPIWVTSILPTTWIDLRRDGGRVNLEAKVCLLFVIPFRTVRIEGLEKVKTKPGTIKVNETEGPDMLVLDGSGGTAELMVLQTAAKDLKKRINGFLSSSSESELSLQSTAHMGISIFCGIWAAVFISIYAIYLLSWTVPHQLQWRFLDWVVERLPSKNRLRTGIETHRHEFERR